MSNELVKAGGNWLFPQTLKDAEDLATTLCASQMVPKQYVNNPKNAVGAMAHGMPLGMNAMQAMQSVAMINGMPGLYGDGLLAVCRSCPAWEWMQEAIDGETAICTAKRRNEPEVTATFSVQDAKRAQLWGKQGPWTQYPTRMLAMRARAFALRNLYADVLRGMGSAEELRDIPAEMPAVQVEPARIDHAEQPQTKAAAILSKARAKRTAKPATIPEVIETQPEPAAVEESSVADSQPTVQGLADIRTIYRNWSERYSPQHSFVLALKQLGEALRDSSPPAARTATEAAYAAIADIDTDDQPDAVREWQAIAAYVEGQVP
jgi:hypothetical protein